MFCFSNVKGFFWHEQQLLRKYDFLQQKNKHHRESGEQIHVEYFYRLVCKKVGSFALFEMSLQRREEGYGRDFHVTDSV